jgi:hypothetical protein
MKRCSAMASRNSPKPHKFASTIAFSDSRTSHSMSASQFDTERPRGETRSPNRSQTSLCNARVSLVVKWRSPLLSSRSSKCTSDLTFCRVTSRKRHGSAHRSWAIDFATMDFTPPLQSNATVHNWSGSVALTCTNSTSGAPSISQSKVTSSSVSHQTSVSRSSLSISIQKAAATWS